MDTLFLKDTKTTSATTSRFKVHPVVVLSILDHYKRRPQGQQRVIGTLLGEEVGNTVVIKNCFPVPHQESEDGESVAVDMAYHQTMLDLHQRVSPSDAVVGWYQTGTELNYLSSLIHAQYREDCEVAEQPVCMTVDVACQGNQLGVHAYFGKEVQLQEGEDCVGRFEQVPLAYIASHAEKIGVDVLINSVPDDEERLDAPANVLSSFDNLELALGNLLDSIETCLDYVSKVNSGVLEGDADIGRAISEALAVVPPSLDRESMLNMLDEKLQDLLMIVYLGNLTRVQLAIADELNASVLSSTQTKVAIPKDLHA